VDNALDISKDCGWLDVIGIELYFGFLVVIYGVSQVLVLTKIKNEPIIWLIIKETSGEEKK